MNETSREQRVWEKGEEITGYDPAIWRRDPLGFVIKRDRYGATNGYGWEIDSVDEVPFHWEMHKKITAAA